jgi:hypothetical protein
MPPQAIDPACPLALSIKSTTLQNLSERTVQPIWNSFCHIAYSRDSWVKLLQPLDECSFDEALLLCQDSPETWVAWVPDRGEVVLNRSQFYC